MYNSEDMASRIKKSFGSCEKTAAREVDAISRVGFNGVNKLMLLTWFSALPVLCLFPKLLRPVMKVEGKSGGRLCQQSWYCYRGSWRTARPEGLRTVLLWVWWLMCPDRKERDGDLLKVEHGAGESVCYQPASVYTHLV